VRRFGLIAFYVLGFSAVVGFLITWRDEMAPRVRVRQQLFAELQPQRVANCELQRVGEAHDGGYLVCGNLLGSVRAAYSYGIAGYDEWGCEISRSLSLRVHEYDCFDTRQPACPGGTLLFHAECVGAGPKSDTGRRYRSLQDQIASNGDQSKPLIIKMDVEGAEWESLEATPDELLQNIEQLVLELHGVDEERFLAVVRRLKQIFVVAHLHFNNFGCREDLAPFPSDAYEVLLVNRRIATIGRAAALPRPLPLDAPNNPSRPDCQ
jgi:hypothetical protein